MPSADAVLAADARAPVLYLRSFADDDLTGAGSLGARVWRSIRWLTHVVSIEQELARVLRPSRAGRCDRQARGVVAGVRRSPPLPPRRRVARHSE